MRLFLALAGPSLLLFLLVQINFLYWPLYWPDEALFSSPAAMLARTGTMGTAVLKGLIPSIEEVTLWNSPLYIVLLSFIYKVTGESLLVMRGFSLFIAILILYTMVELLHRLRFSLFYLIAVPCALVLDLTFSRAANTGRMDLLTLLFLLLAFRQLLLMYYHKDENEKRRLFWSGVYGGLAVLSHPGGFMVLALFMIFLYDRRLRLVYVAIGLALPLLAWGLYILPNWSAFELQFLSQIMRKVGMLEAAGSTKSDTGGLWLVYLAQFGASKYFMIAVLLQLVIIFGIGAFSIYRNRTHAGLFLSALAILGMVLLGSEAWYAVYTGPFLLLLAAFLDRHRKYLVERLPFFAMLSFGILSSMVFTWRNQNQGYTEAIAAFMENITRETRACQTIYLRLRPDPYFQLRQSAPAQEILEFIPGKLHYKGIDERLIQRYAEIDCFLLDGNDSWEPILTGYLEEQAAGFAVRSVEAKPPLESARLFVREAAQR